jgi:DNA-binding transcriptional ArsR family regulator
MVNQSTSLDRAFHALADPARRAMVQRLTRGPTSVTELARPLSMSLPAVLQHLGVLERSGLVRSQKSGRVRTCRINAEALSLAEHWISARRTEWSARLDRLDDYLRNSHVNDTQPSIPGSVVHAVFHIDRTFATAPSRVFRAFADPAAKALWFTGTPGKWTELERVMDFRVGGRELAKGRMAR